MDDLDITDFGSWDEVCVRADTVAFDLVGLNLVDKRLEGEVGEAQRSGCLAAEREREEQGGGRVGKKIVDGGRRRGVGVTGVVHDERGGMSGGWYGVTRGR